MVSPKHNLTDDWLIKAGDDEKNAVSILTHRDGTPSGVCFLSQQMAEKYLKALLIFHAQTFPKIHDLLELSTRLLNMESAVVSIQEDLVILNRYYIETRYPGDYPEFAWPDAEEALESAQRVKVFVMSRIQQKK